MNDNENVVHTASDLFGIERYLQRSGKPMDERASLIAYFSDQLGRPPKQIGVRLAHYDLGQLYALKSAYRDRLNRNGAATAGKWFWWFTRTKAL